MRGLRKQVIEAKEGPLELRRKKDKGSYLGEEEVGKKWERCGCAPERQPVCWVQDNLSYLKSLDLGTLFTSAGSCWSNI